ncbi:MAG: hypothetical protein Fur003_3270 [Candidatus Dojkabacteria bacterium]
MTAEQLQNFKDIVNKSRLLASKQKTALIEAIPELKEDALIKIYHILIDFEKKQIARDQRMEETLSEMYDQFKDEVLALPDNADTEKALEGGQSLIQNLLDIFKGKSQA